MKKVQIFILTVIVIVIAIVVLAVVSNKNQLAKENPVRLAAVDKVAQCLTDTGVKFYGASWCPHCARQKGLFMKSAKKLPYIECSTAGAGSPQTQACIDANITSYPTWEFGIGDRMANEITPIDLADKAKCILDDAERAELIVQKSEHTKEVEALKANQTIPIQ